MREIWFYYLLPLFIILGCHKREITNPVDPRYELASPVLISAYNEEHSNLTLHWESSDGEPELFNIFRKTTQQDSFILYDIVPGSNQKFIDSAVTEDVRYSYCVSSDWYDRESSQSNYLTAGIFQFYKRYFSRIDKDLDADDLCLSKNKDSTLIMLSTISKSGVSKGEEFQITESDIYGNQILRLVITGYWGIEILESNDGGFVVLCGKSRDTYLIKIDREGSTIWNVKFNNSVGRKLEKTIDGQYIVLLKYSLENGYFKISRVDDDGIIENEVSISIGTWGTDQSCSVICTNDNGYLFVGPNIVDISNRMIRAIKINANGEIEYNKVLPVDGFSTEKRYHSYLLLKTTDNHFMIMARDGYKRKIWFIKIDISGNLLWYTNHLFDNNQVIKHIAQSTDNSYVFLLHNSDNSHLSINKINPDGEFVWNHEYECKGFAEGRRIKTLSNGDNIIFGITRPLVGDTKQYLLLMKLNSNGQLN
ncbi:MAG: hypothetical protein H8E98_03520 [Bacteroidetes bacterium]|nr:hypothetical protein [Bacteroidota bacterium]